MRHKTAEIDGALDPELDRLSRRALLGRATATVGAATLAPLAGADPAQSSRALDDPNLERQSIAFHSDGHGHPKEISAFLASPRSSSRRGGVIVIHEIFGLTDHIKDVACRLAQAGYDAIAPDLFTREGSPPPLSGGFEPLMKFATAIPDAQVLADLKAAMKHLRALPNSNHKVGCVGFCWGGRMSMLLDADAHNLDAAVAYYGRVSGATTENQPQNPIDVVEKMHAPLLGHFGAEDQSIPPAEANKLRDALARHRKTAEIYVYEHAGHAFNNDTREGFRPEAAQLAWQRTLDWFEHFLKS
jgi:carboxymethylenebutenolidase